MIALDLLEKVACFYLLYDFTWGESFQWRLEAVNFTDNMQYTACIY